MDNELLKVLLQGMADDIKTVKNQNDVVLREVEGIKERLEVFAQGQLKLILDDTKQYALKMQNAKSSKEAEIYAEDLSQKLDVHMDSGVDFETTLNDAFPSENDAFKKEMKEEFIKLKRWIKDVVVVPLDKNDGVINGHVIKSGNQIGDFVEEIEKTTRVIEQKVQSISESVKRIPTHNRLV